MSNKGDSSRFQTLSEPVNQRGIGFVAGLAMCMDSDAGHGVPLTPHDFMIRAKAQGGGWAKEGHGLVAIQAAGEAIE